MQRGTTINSDAYISTLQKMSKCFQSVQPDKNLHEMLLQHNNGRPHTSVKDQEMQNLLDGVTASALQAQLNTFRFSPLHTPGRCSPQKEV
jgi:hypothetical protein